MNRILTIIDTGDCCSLLFLTAVLVFLGNRLVEGTPRLRLWGQRLAYASLIAYCLYSGVTCPPDTPGACLMIVLRALLAAGLTLGVTWTLLPAFAFLWRVLIEGPRTTARQVAAAARHTASEARARRRNDAEQAERRRADAERYAHESQKESQMADTHRRRADARARAALSYSLLAPKIGSRFTRQMLDDYIATYMGDEQSPDDVERRGDELLATLNQHLEEEEPTRTALTLEQLQAWFHAEKQRIESSSADACVKRQLVAALNVRYADLASSIMEDLQP
jgi:hypothetical protein